MPSAWPRLSALLHGLISRTSRTKVVSGDSSGPDSDRPQERSSLDFDVRFGQSVDVESQDWSSPIHDSLAASNGHQLHESDVQQLNQGPRTTHRPAHEGSCANSTHNETSSVQSLGGHSVHGHHRRTSSAASEISLSSVLSTTGAYAGFTQHGQYDLAQDVILRGEFISEQQAKVAYRAPCNSACMSVISMLICLCAAGCHCKHSSCYLHWCYNLSRSLKLQTQKGASC